MRSNHPLLARAGLRYLLRHPWQAVLALVGIVLGVAVVLAVDLANSAAKRSFSESAEQLRGATTHRLVNPAGDVPQGLYTRLHTTPGAPPMAPVIAARVRVAGIEGRFRLYGLDLFAEGAFRDTLTDVVGGGGIGLGEWLAGSGAVALGRAAADRLDVAVGDHLLVHFEGRPYPLEVAAIHPATGDATRDLLIVDIATAQAITGMQDTISHVDLVLDGDRRAWLMERLPQSVRLVEAVTQADGITGMSAAFELNLTAMSLLALLVGMFLIFNAMTFAIVQRRNLLGRLRALGVTPREIATLVLIEAMVLALVGTLLGLVLGVVLGRGLTGIVAATVSALYYEVTAASAAVTPASLFKASLLGIAGTLLASWLPALHAARTPPLTTLSRSALETGIRHRLPRAGILGIILVGVGLAVSMALPGGLLTGFAGLFVLLVGAAMATPLALTGMHRLLSAMPLTGMLCLASRDLNRHLSRLSTAAAALMVALAASVGVAIMVESMRSSVDVWLDSLLTADLYVSAEDFADAAPLPRSVEQRVAALPGVAAVSRYRDRRVQIDGRPTALVGADLAERSRVGFRFVDRMRDPWQAFDHGAVLVSEPLAFRLRLSAGDSVRLPTATGPRPFTIAAVFQDYASERGRVFVPMPVYREHWDDMDTDTLALFATAGAGGDLYERAVAALSADFALDFVSAREIYAESMRIFDRTFRITEVLRYLSLLVAFVGILSALMAIQIERRREYAVLRALGFTAGQLMRLILLQSAMLGLLAGVVAIPTGMAMAWVLTDVIQLRAFGWSMQYLITPGPLLVSVALGLAAALLAGVYPAWRTGREPPGAQLRED